MTKSEKEREMMSHVVSAKQRETMILLLSLMRKEIPLMFRILLLEQKEN
jgi:hypothetical protein